MFKIFYNRCDFPAEIFRTEIRIRIRVQRPIGLLSRRVFSANFVDPTAIFFSFFFPLPFLLYSSYYYPLIHSFLFGKAPRLIIIIR
jgi:hypothetical protein